MMPALAIGIGFRKACSADALVAIVRDALARLPGGGGRDAVLVTIAEKDRPVLREAASRLGLAVMILPKTALAGTDDRVTIRSGRVAACLGIPSVAEAAALAAAGPGSRLLVSRLASGGATCALAARAELP